jgi:hypothetical protein
MKRRGQLPPLGNIVTSVLEMLAKSPICDLTIQRRTIELLGLVHMQTREENANWMGIDRLLEVMGSGELSTLSLGDAVMSVGFGAKSIDPS